MCVRAVPTAYDLQLHCVFRHAALTREPSHTRVFDSCPQVKLRDALASLPASAEVCWVRLRTGEVRATKPPPSSCVFPSFLQRLARDTVSRKREKHRDHSTQSSGLAQYSTVG